MSLGVGPGSAIVRVDTAALPSDGSANHLVGLGVGFRHENGMENSKKLQPLVSANTFTPDMVNLSTLANVQVFYSFIGMEDAQVLINLNNGVVRGIDYGACFGNLSNSSPTMVQIGFSGFTAQITPTPAQYKDAIDLVKGLTDADILTAVCNIPQEADWRSEFDRRREIAYWLQSRRASLDTLVLR